MFHSFIMSRHCKDRHIEHDYLKDFESISPFMDDATLRLLAWPLMADRGRSGGSSFERDRIPDAISDGVGVLPLDATVRGQLQHGERGQPDEGGGQSVGAAVAEAVAPQVQRRQVAAPARTTSS